MDIKPTACTCCWYKYNRMRSVANQNNFTSVSLLFMSFLLIPLHGHLLI